MKKHFINLAIVSSFAFAATAVHADFVVSEGAKCVVSGTGEPVRSGFQEHGRSCDSGRSMPASPKQPVASMPASPKQPVASTPASSMQPVTAVPASPKQSASSVSASDSSWDGHGSSGHAASYLPAGVVASTPASSASSMQPVAAIPSSPKQSASSVSGSGSSWDGHGSSGHAASYLPAGAVE